MSLRDQFEHILASLHETVLDDARWPATSALIDELCGSKGNLLVSGDGVARDDIDIFFARFCYRGQLHAEWQREYFEVFHALDEAYPPASGTCRTVGWFTPPRSTPKRR